MTENTYIKIINLEDWRIVEDAHEDLKGEQRIPAKVALVAQDRRISLSVVLPSGVAHDIALEMDAGLLRLNVWGSRTGRDSTKDKGLQHEAPILTAYLGSDSSVFKLCEDLDGPCDDDEAPKFDFKHVDGGLYRVTAQQADEIIVGEQKAASEAQPEPSMLPISSSTPAP